MIKKIIEQGAGHLVIVTYRQLASAVLLFPIAYFHESLTHTPRILCYLFFIALIGVTLTQYTFLIGLEFTTTFSTAFLNIVPVATFLMALLFRSEKVKIREKSGIAEILGTVGGAVVITLYRGIVLNNSHSSKHEMCGSVVSRKLKWALGSVVLFAGTLMWSSWFLVQAVIGKSYPGKR